MNSAHLFIACCIGVVFLDMALPPNWYKDACKAWRLARMYRATKWGAFKCVLRNIYFYHD